MGLPTHWGADLVEHADEPETLAEYASEHERQIAALRGDVAKWATMADRTRLARELSRLAVVRRLQGNPAASRPLFEEAIALFDADGRDVARHLATIRMAHADVAAGHPSRAIDSLVALEAEVSAAHHDHLLFVRGLARARAGDLPGARGEWEAVRETRLRRGRDKALAEIDALLVHLAAHE